MDKQNYQEYVPAKWMRDQLQIYKTLRRLRDNPAFRHKWVEQQLRIIKKARPDIDEKEQYDLMHAYLNEFDFRYIQTGDDPPTVHIEPIKFRNKYFTKILGIKTTNMSRALRIVVRQATKDIIEGYGKTAVLGNIFGKEYRNKLNRYIKDKLIEGFS